jgi:hypothetical protein
MPHRIPNVAPDVALLPKLTAMMFAFRCAQRIAPFCKRGPRTLDGAVKAAEAWASGVPLPEWQDEAKEAFDLSETALREWGTYHDDTADAVFDLEGAVGVACGYAAGGDALNAYRATMTAIGWWEELIRERRGMSYRSSSQPDWDEVVARREQVLHDMQRDYELLRDAARRERWKDNTPVPSYFFAVRSLFVTPEHCVEVIPLFKRKVVEYFAKHPEHMHALAPWQFEELVGEILTRFGYHVELTQRTRDGGFDLFAISHQRCR